jgi:hypothetical protein
MQLPAIRYPLPTLVLVLLLGLVVWRGEAMTRPLRAALAERLNREIKGPDYPSSDKPQVIAGPIIRKGLLLHDETAVSETPVAPPSRSIRLRMFVEVFDVWPMAGEPTHYRVGNREPIGWVRAQDLLPWSTRLVVRSPEGIRDLSDKIPALKAVGRATLPVLDGSRDPIGLAVWEPDRPWTQVARRAEVKIAVLSAEAWGAWLSREELLALLRRSLAATDRPTAEAQLRIRAVLGRLLDDRPLTDSDLTAARAALPEPVFTVSPITSETASDRLARINEQWAPEASWGGLAFQFIPLSALP